MTSFQVVKRVSISRRRYCQLAATGMIAGLFGGEERLGLVGIEAPS